jgi:hypothetical protein
VQVWLVCLFGILEISGNREHCHNYSGDHQWRPGDLLVGEEDFRKLPVSSSAVLGSYMMRAD